MIHDLCVETINGKIFRFHVLTGIQMDHMTLLEHLPQISERCALFNPQRR